MTIDDLVAMAESGAAPDMQRAALGDVLSGNGVGSAAINRLMAHVRDGIVLRPSRDRAVASRIGGPGFLPAGEPWPLDPAGRPLNFVASLDLSELPKLNPLPAEGTLLLFWDFDWPDQGAMDFVTATRVIWVPPGEAVEAHDTPSGTFDEFAMLPIRGQLQPVAGEPELVLPELPDPADRELLLAAMNEIAPRLYGHQLLGAPREVQGPVFREIPYWFGHAFPETRARFSEAELAGDGWILLAQIEEDRDIPNLLIGDGGKLYFVVPDVDLRERRFDRIMGIMQCH